MKLNQKKSIFILTIICFMVLGNGVAFAETIQESIFFTGTMKLLNDSSKALMVLAPIIGAVLGVFFFIRKGAADEMDQKTWQKRINNTLFAVIGAELIGVAINLISSYYTP